MNTTRRRWAAAALATFSGLLVAGGLATAPAHAAAADNASTCAVEFVQQRPPTGPNQFYYGFQQLNGGAGGLSSAIFGPSGTGTLDTPYVAVCNESNATLTYTWHAQLQTGSKPVTTTTGTVPPHQTRIVHAAVPGPAIYALVTETPPPNPVTGPPNVYFAYGALFRA